MQRALTIAGATACLAIVVVGCGSGSSSTSSSPTSIESLPTSAGAPPVPTGGPSGSVPPPVASGPIAKKIAALRAKEIKANAERIKSYGSEAGGSEKAAIVGAMRSFLLALDAHDYAKACDGLLAKARAIMERLARFTHQSESCAAHLARVAPFHVKDPAKAANGSVTEVRVGEGTAYVLYHPAGGGPLSYFTLEDENGEWKVPALEAGFPLYPPLPAQK